jgi:membrane protein YqaA with SNARE-associated domain
MCPACLGNLALLAAGASSSSGLTAFALAKFLKKRQTNRKKQNGNQQINREIVSQAEDRMERTET